MDVRESGNVKIWRKRWEIKTRSEIKPKEYTCRENKKNDREAFSENVQQTPLISKNRGTLPLKNPVGVLRILPNKAHDIKIERNLMRGPFS